MCKECIYIYIYSYDVLNIVLDTWKATFLHSMPAPVTCWAMSTCGSCLYVIGGERPSPALVVSGSGLLVISRENECSKTLMGG